MTRGFYPYSLSNVSLTDEGMALLPHDSAIAGAMAGHAGETSVPGMMPHELVGGIAILAGIGLALIILAAIGIWLLIRIERQVRKLK